MALASSRADVICRSKGQSATAAAAYRAGEKIIDERTGETHDYTKKKGIIYTEILAPENASNWMYDRPTLWNRVEQEKRKDAQLARTLYFALPREFNDLQNIKLAKEYAQQFVKEGMIADLCIHDKRDGNPHIHILLTMRNIDGETFGLKNRDWNNMKNVELWREQFAELTNKHLERYGHKQRIDMRSYEKQGIDKTPTIHLGHHAHKLEQKGIQTERGNINREIEEKNRQLEATKQEIAETEKARKHEETRLQEERRKVAGQGKERKGEQPELDRPLSFKERYMQEAKRRIVRDPERQPTRRYSNHYKQEKNLQDREKKEKADHHHSTDKGQFADRYRERMNQEQQTPTKKLQQTMPNSDQAEKQVKREFKDRYHERMKQKRTLEQEKGKEHERNK